MLIHTAQRVVAGLAAAVITFALFGCDGDTASTPSSSVSSSAATGGDAKQLAQQMTGALAATGGGQMLVSSSNGSLAGRLSFGPLNATKGIGEIWNTGTFTAPDKRTATYIMHTGPGPDDEEIYINDGTPLKGRTWAKVPHFASEMKDAATLLKTHPDYGIIPDLLPGLQPHVLPSLLAAQSGLVRSPQTQTLDGVEVTQYLGSFDGSVPASGAAATFELYVDKENRPTRFVATINEGLITTRYGNWGKQPAVKAPAEADTSVVPTAS